MKVQPTPARRGQDLPGGEWIKIALMGVLLAVLVFLAVFYEPQSDAADTGRPQMYEGSTAAPVLSPDILAQAADRTRAERLVTEVAPLQHLLQQSLLVTPAVARKLGMPQQQASVDVLRRSPDTYRGDYIWFKGQLEYVSKPNPGHPVPGYSYYEARIKTADDERVLFTFSVPPPAGLKVGDWVRIEGFFMKLRDAHFPVALDRAPMLVGPEIFSAYADWEAVEELDPAVLAAVRDGDWVGKSQFANAGDMPKMLDESQGVPLWHLASYALNQRGKKTPEEWRRVPAFVHKEQFERFRRGEIPKGTPMRILGTYVQGRVLPARVNPLGIESWSEIWIQVRDLGAKTIPVWIPNRIAGDWRRNKPAVCNAYFYKRYQYTSLEGDTRWTPLFVAASLDEFKLPINPLNTVISAIFGLVVLGVGLLLFLLARRDRKQRQAHESDLLARRRRRRAAAKEHEQPCPS